MNEAVSRPQWHCPHNGLNVKPHPAKLQGLNTWSLAGGAVLGDSGRKLFSSRMGFEVYRLAPLPVLSLLSIFPSPFTQLWASSHRHAVLCPPKQRATGLSPLRFFSWALYHRRRRGRRKEEEESIQSTLCKPLVKLGLGHALWEGTMGQEWTSSPLWTRRTSEQKTGT